MHKTSKQVLYRCALSNRMNKKRIIKLNTQLNESISNEKDPANSACRVYMSLVTSDTEKD